MIWFKEDSNTSQAELRADSAADLSDLPEFAESHNLMPGSTCLVIGEGKMYMMDSTKAWVAL